MNSNFRGWLEKLLRRFGARSQTQQIVILAACFMIAVGAVGLISYGISLLASSRTIRELREAGEASGPAPTEFITSSANSAITAAPAGTETPGLPERPEETSVPTVETATADRETAVPGEPASRFRTLPQTGYPDNPGKQISSVFQNLQQKNRDIIGWLKMGGIVDEAVVQRDNEFYLDHDALANSNINGALFLDEGVNLNFRPYVYIIYGHNMRAGAEFGSLRNYENRSFYQRDPFVSFDTLYDSGEYVIFSVGTISVEETGNHFVDFFAFLFRNAQEHQQAFETLQHASIYPKALDVKADDQILLLVTCVTDVHERRVVAARRIRDGERKEDLIEAIAQSLH